MAAIICEIGRVDVGVLNARVLQVILHGQNRFLVLLAVERMEDVVLMREDEDVETIGRMEVLDRTVVVKVLIGRVELLEVRAVDEVELTGRMRLELVDAVRIEEDEELIGRVELLEVKRLVVDDEMMGRMEEVVRIETEEDEDLVVTTLLELMLVDEDIGRKVMEEL